MSDSETPNGRLSHVQSVSRAFLLLDILADAGEDMTISELATRSALPHPTIHRLLQTLVSLGYARQLSSRRYALGAQLIKLGERAKNQLGGPARPVLASLVADLGETSNLAVLDRDAAVYVVQVPSPHPMRMFTEVGRRVHLHYTAVGKAMLSAMADSDVEAIMSRVGMPTPTDNSHGTLEELFADLAHIRECGYAIDDEETALGVRCYAALIPDAPAPIAVSVSGPRVRVDHAFGERAVPLLLAAAERIGDLLAAD